MTETLEKRLESGMGELDTNLKSLDIDVQHHVRRREKVGSLKSELEKNEKELVDQRSTLEAQQSATQSLLQGMEDYDIHWKKETHGYKLVGRSQIRILAFSRLSQEPGSTICSQRYHG